MTVVYIVVGLLTTGFGILWYMALMMADTQSSTYDSWLAVLLVICGALGTIYGVARLFE